MILRQHPQALSDSKISPELGIRICAIAMSDHVHPAVAGNTLPSNLPLAHDKRGGAGILVNPRQKGNPVLKLLPNWAFVDGTEPDFVVGERSCILFISLRYHLLHPEYIHSRFEPLRNQYESRVLLTLVDLEDNERVLLSLTKIAFPNGWTMLLAWSTKEAALYVQRLRVLQNVSAASIQATVDPSPQARFSAVLQAIKSVNKTDVVTLAGRFRTLRRLSAASLDDLSECPGIGPTKALRIYETFHRPFA